MGVGRERYAGRCIRRRRKRRGGDPGWLKLTGPGRLGAATGGGSGSGRGSGCCIIGGGGRGGGVGRRGKGCACSTSSVGKRIVAIRNRRLSINSKMIS